ncbi:hypothetical protein [Maricaulis sp.]|uniref:hypothetical protein n=1 Tax=Maricaulis sp. TaxID=1486257 RepID=UPI003A93468D
MLVIAALLLLLGGDDDAGSCGRYVDQSYLQSAELVFLGTPLHMNVPGGNGDAVYVGVAEMLKGNYGQLNPGSSYWAFQAGTMETTVWDALMVANSHFDEGYLESQMYSGGVVEIEHDQACRTELSVVPGVTYLFVIGDHWVRRSVEPIADLGNDPWLRWVRSELE